jgi:peptidyl-prolyl cis-trans isomerase A (cyclophilin A)
MNHRRFVGWIALTVVIIAIPLVLADETDRALTPPEGLSEGWYARIDTSMGRIIVRLLPDQAPQSVAHFTAMAEGRLEWFDRVAGEVKKGPYYDGNKVHRAVAGHLFEAGAPQDADEGSPDLFVPLEGRGPVNFNAPDRLGLGKRFGLVSGVQFFVTASAQPRLTAYYPCIGIVVTGRDVVTRISQVKTHRDGRPIEAPVIERIRVFSVGDPAPLPEPQPYRSERRDVEFYRDNDQTNQP